MPLVAGFRITVYQRGDSGLPGTKPLPDLAPRAQSYTHTITDKFGFESCQVTLTVDFDEALDWLNNGLMRSVIVVSPDAETVWEGYLNTVEARFGQETRSVSLDTLANQVRVKYTTVLGTPGTTTAVEDTASQLLYGTRDLVLSADQSDSTEAGYYATVELARRKDPQMRPTTEVATGEVGGVQLTLSFVGWYGTLDWLVFSRSSTTKTSTTSQVGTLLGLDPPGVGQTNPFISTATHNIIASGITVTEYVAPETTYREKIEDLLRRGTGTYPLTWGVYEDREFYVQAWAGATPEVITYQRYLGSSDVHVPNGGIIPPWNIRPNAMYQAIDLLDVAPVATAQDAAARFYVARVTCTIDGDRVGVSLEPEEPSDLSAILIRKYQ